jgi:hypothetical protein
MISLLFWCLTIYGICNIGVYGSLLNGFRDKIESWGNNPNFPLNHFFHFLREMMRCMMCLPTWIGFIFGIFILSPSHIFLGLPWWISWFFDGAFASGTTWIINSIIEWFEQNRPVSNHHLTIKNDDKILKD